MLEFEVEAIGRALRFKPQKPNSTPSLGFLRPRRAGSFLFLTLSAIEAHLMAALIESSADVDMEGIWAYPLSQLEEGGSRPEEMEASSSAFYSVPPSPITPAPPLDLFPSLQTRISSLVQDGEDEVIGSSSSSSSSPSSSFCDVSASSSPPSTKKTPYSSTFPPFSIPDVVLSGLLADPHPSLSARFRLSRPQDKRDVISLTIGLMNNVIGFPVPLTGLHIFPSPFVPFPGGSSLCLPLFLSHAQDSFTTDSQRRSEALRRLNLLKQSPPPFNHERILSPVIHTKECQTSACTHHLFLEDSSRYGFCAHTSLYSIGGHTTMWSSARKYFFAEILLPPMPGEAGSTTTTFRHCSDIINAARNLDVELSFDESQIRRHMFDALCSLAQSFCKDCFYCKFDRKAFRCSFCKDLVWCTANIPGPCSPVKRADVKMPPGTFFLCCGCQEGLADKCSYGRKRQGKYVLKHPVKK